MSPHDLLWLIWQHSLAPWLARLTDPALTLPAPAPESLPDPLALAGCLLAQQPQTDWPARILPVFAAEALAAVDQHCFWLDLLAALLARRATEHATDLSPARPLDDPALTAFAPGLLCALWQAVPAPAGSSQQLNAIYAHWRALTPHDLKHPLQARLLLHLLALSLGHYASDTPARAAGIKPLLVVWLQRWFSQPLADQGQLLAASWPALPGLAGAGYGWLARLQQQARAIAEELSFPQRNDVFQALEQSDGSLSALEQVVCRFMSRRLQRDNPLALGWLDSLIRHESPDTSTGTEAQQTPAYRLLGAALRGLSGPALSADDPQHRPPAPLLQHLVRVLPLRASTLAEPARQSARAAASAGDGAAADDSPRWQSWQSCPAEHPARAAASSYPTALARYWQSPGPRAFERWGSQGRFRTRWVPDGEIVLYQLLDFLLQQHEASDTLSRETLCQQLLTLQLLQSDGPEQRQLQALPRYHALIDACERLLCPARTNAGESHSLQGLQTLLATLYPGPVIDNLQLQRFVLACLSWRPPAGVSLANFRSSLCPVESYREEGLARSASPVICHSFLAPFSYLRDESSGQNLPAAFVSGGCYQLDPPGARPLPFVASQYQHHVAAATPLLRLIFDPLLLQAQREAARYRQHLAEQAAREAHYLQLRQQLQDYQRQQQALQQAWQGIQQALEAPFLQRLGLHSQGVLETLFSADAQLGSDASGRPLRASHRPGYLQQVGDLAAYLCYAASGDASLPPPAWPGSLPAALWQLSQQLPADDLTTARRCFGWFKLNTYDAWLPGSNGHQLQLGQLAQALWLVQAQLSPPAPAALGLWHQTATAPAAEDLSALLQGSIAELLAAQPRLCGLDFTRPDADTRQARSVLPLHGPALAFCQQLQALLLQHLQGSPDRVRLQRCEAHWISSASGDGLQLRLWCSGHFSPAALARLRSAPESGGSHDLRQLLQDLHAALSGSKSLWALESGTPPDGATGTASAAGQVLTPGLSLWQLPDGQSLFQLCAGLLPTPQQALPGVCFLDQGRSERWRALGLQDLQPLLSPQGAALSPASWRQWLARQSSGLLVLHLHEKSASGDYLLLDPAWLQDLPPGLQVLLVSGGEPETLARWLDGARQAWPAAAPQLQLYPETLSAESAPGEIEQLGWQRLLQEQQHRQPLNLGIFAELRQLLALLEAWEDSGFAQQGLAWQALQTAAARWQLPAAQLQQLQYLPHDSLAAWRMWVASAQIRAGA